jgi:WD40 repeat protein
MQELLSLSGESAAEEKIIQKLADASLLTTAGELSHEGAFVEVAHEALIRNWSQLRKWIDADRAGLRTRTRLTEAAREWKNSGCDSTYIYSGARLAVAKEWASAHAGELSTEEAEFLRCSLEAQQEREARELQAVQRLARAEAERAEAEKRRLADVGRERVRRRYLITTLLPVTLATGSISYFAYRQANTEKALRQVESEHATKRSDLFLELAQERLNKQEDPKKDVIALHWLSRALNAYPRNAKAAELTRDLLCGKVWCSALTPGLQSESESPLLSATFGPEGQVFAVSSDGNFLSWNGDGSSLILRQALLSEESPSTGDNFASNKAVNLVAAACFSHNGERLLVISPPARSVTTARAQVWSWSSQSTSYERKCPSIEITDPSQYYSILWSTDGNLLVVISRREYPSYQVFQYDGRGYRDLQTPFGLGKVAAASFSDDDKLLATVSPEGAVRLWDTATLKTATVTTEVKGSFNLSRDPRPTSLAFLPDKSVLVMTFFSQPIQFLNIRTGELKQVSSPRRQDQAMRLVFTPQQAGKRLAAITYNGRVEIKEASALDEAGAEPICLKGVVGCSRFSPDGKKILILSGPYWMAFDTVQVWDTDLKNPMLEAKQMPLDGGSAPLWLADLAEVQSARGGRSSDDDEAPLTMEDMRKKYSVQQRGRTYQAVWRRFFPE